MIFCLIDPQVFWSDSGELCCIATEDSFYILRYNQEAASKGLENKDEFMTEDGIEEAFEVCFEHCHMLSFFDVYTKLRAP